MPLGNSAENSAKHRFIEQGFGQKKTPPQLTVLAIFCEIRNVEIHTPGKSYYLLT